jgi:hypothetical protein
MMMGEVVGRERMGQAMALDVGASNASRAVGPALGGVGLEGAFLLSTLLYVKALAATLAIRTRIGAAPGVDRMLARLREGFDLVLKDRRLTGVMVVTVIYNLFGWPFTSMIPVIGSDCLRLGAQGIGRLASVEGIGAFTGALLLALWLRPGWHAPGYVGGVAGLPGGRDRLCARHRARRRRRGAAALGAERCRLRRPAGDDRLSRGAARHALAHPGRALALHRHRPDWLRLAGPARRPHRRQHRDAATRKLWRRI